MYPNGSSVRIFTLGWQGLELKHEVVKPVPAGSWDRLATESNVVVSSGKRRERQDRGAGVVSEIYDNHFKASGYPGAVPFAHKFIVVNALYDEGTFNIEDKLALLRPADFPLSFQVEAHKMAFTVAMPTDVQQVQWESKAARRKINKTGEARLHLVKLEMYKFGLSLIKAADGYEVNNLEAIPAHHVMRVCRFLLDALASVEPLNETAEDDEAENF